MFYYLKGEIIARLRLRSSTSEASAYQRLLNTLSKLGIGAKTTLYTHMYVREDYRSFTAFRTPRSLTALKCSSDIRRGAESRAFCASAITPQQLALSVATGDEKPLLTAQGIGKKLAMRIILELKDKISSEQSVSAGVSYVPISDSAGEASAALAVLGYSRDEISAALKGVDTANLTVEEIVRSALKGLMKP